MAVLGCYRRLCRPPLPLQKLKGDRPLGRPRGGLRTHVDPAFLLNPPVVDGFGMFIVILNSVQILYIYYNIIYKIYRYIYIYYIYNIII